MISGKTGSVVNSLYQSVVADVEIMLAIRTHTAVKILCFHTIVEIARHHIIILVFSEERGVVVTCLNTALIFTAGNKAFHHIVTCYLRIAETG